MIRSFPSCSKSCSVPCSPAATLTAYSRCADIPNSGVRQIAAIPSSVAANTSRSPASIRASGSSCSPQRWIATSSYSCVRKIPSFAARRFSAPAGAVTGISTRHSFSLVTVTGVPRRIRRAVR